MQKNTQHFIKRTVGIIMALVLTILCIPVPAYGSEIKTASAAAILMDAETGKVLYSKNRSKQLSPASITKILTALLAVESCRPDEVMTVHASALNIPKGYAHIALMEGDTITVEDAMYAMMLPSAFDAANVLAEYVGGSQKEFAALMNLRARKIGAVKSNFRNPSGMYAKKHYSTVYDMALITREAIQNDDFMKYFGAVSYTLPSFNEQTEKIEISGYQYMMLEDKDEYDPGVIGGKIGYTPESGHTMSTVATRGGKTLICIVMGSTRDGKYRDTQMLLDYGFGKKYSQNELKQ